VSTFFGVVLADEQPAVFKKFEKENLFQIMCAGVCSQNLLSLETQVAQISLSVSSSA
jgi:hypothetical protein